MLEDIYKLLIFNFLLYLILNCKWDLFKQFLRLLDDERNEFDLKILKFVNNWKKQINKNKSFNLNNIDVLIFQYA